MLPPSSSFTNDRHKWKDKRENETREFVLFLGAIENQNVRISLLPARWEITLEWRICI